jgi:hypothetical protein
MLPKGVRTIDSQKTACRLKVYELLIAIRLHVA